MHSAPADFAFRGQPLAVALGNGAGFAKRARDLRGVAVCIRGPIGGAGSGIDADNSVAPDADLAELLRDGAGFLYLRKKIRAICIGAHRRSASRRLPNWGDHGADYQIASGNLFRELLQLAGGGINVDVRSEQEQIDA